MLNTANWDMKTVSFILFFQQGLADTSFLQYIQWSRTSGKIKWELPVIL